MLAIVQAVADAHGGEVRAAPSDAGGARFELELPGFVARAPVEPVQAARQ